MPKACYRKLKNYKYQLMKDYVVSIPIKPAGVVNTKFIKLTMAGKLTVKDRYSWDGASGPAIDTKSIMRGSLVHDALYQLMRERFLDYKKDRKAADKVLHDICRQDGMSKLRARYIYDGVRLGGRKSAKPPKKVKDKIICVP